MRISYFDSCEIIGLTVIYQNEISFLLEVSIDVCSELFLSFSDQ